MCGTALSATIDVDTDRCFRMRMAQVGHAILCRVQRPVLRTIGMRGPVPVTLSRCSEDEQSDVLTVVFPNRLGVCSI